jgi:ketosteroid isomerase-like protein
MADLPDLSQPAASLSAAEEAEVRSTVEAWTSCLGHDWDRWIDYYDESAVVLVPGERRLSGRDAIARYVRAIFGDVERLGFEDWGIDGSGDLAVVDNDMVRRAAGESEDRVAKQIVVLRRTEPGRWVVTRVAFGSPGD